MTPLVYLSSAPEDSTHRDALVKHVAPALREGGIALWHPGRLHAGVDVDAEIRRRLASADLVVMLITADYLASDTCLREMDLALERAERGEARVVPVLLRPCLKNFHLIDKLQALPSNGKAVTTWPNADEAWTSVALDIHLLLSPERPSVPIWYEPVKARNETISRESLRMRRPLDAPTIAHLAKLEDACARRRRVRDTGVDHTSLDAEIRDLKTKIREGGQLRQGDILGERYTLLQYIGHGGFANVWEAEDRKERRRVALKVLHPNLAGDPEKTQRFQRGAWAMAALKHDAVVRILDERVEDGGYYCFAMELMRGGTLQKAILDKTLPPERIFPLVLRVCDALVEAHSHRFVHRDVKPANVLLDEEGSPRLTDFDLVIAEGTSNQTRSGQMGTFLFAAPELQERPQDADVRADVYSMGMTALFCLHGGLPLLRALDRTLDKLPGQRVADVLRKAVAQRPEDRYRDMRSFRQALVVAHARDAAGNFQGLRLTATRTLPVALPVVLLSLIAGYGAKKALLNPRDSPPQQPTSDTSAAATSPLVRGGPAALILPASPKATPPVVCPEGMIGIPGGTFVMGSPRDEKEADPDDELAHTVALHAFCIDRTEVTVRAFRRCVADEANPKRCRAVPRTTYKTAEDRASFWNSLCNGAVADREEHPINCVDWEMADGYCKWRGAQLPTEAQWEYAAGGPERRRYPWGAAEPGAKWLNACGTECRDMAERNGQPNWEMMFDASDQWPGTAIVGTIAGDTSAFGVRDMGGNLLEWVEDWYSPYDAGGPEPLQDPVRAAPPSAGAPTRVLRGGGWASSQMERVRSAYRWRALPEKRSVEWGFRCASSPPGTGTLALP